MRVIRFVLPACVVFAAGDIAAQQLMPAPARPGSGAGQPDMQLLAPGLQRPLTAAEAQALIGGSAHTRDGIPAGEIRDFTLAGPDGRIDRIVLALGGFLGIGAKVYSVPAATLRLGASRTVPTTGQARPMDIILDLSGEDVEVAPDFTYGSGTHTLVGRR